MNTKTESARRIPQAVLCQIYCVCTVLIWGITNACIRFLIPYLSTLSIASVRLVFASITLFIVVRVKKLPIPPKKDMPYFALAGVATYVGYSILSTFAMQTLDAATCSVLVATAPVMTAIVAFLIWGEKIRPLGWAAIVIEFGGVVLLALMRGSFSFETGVLLAIISAVCMCVYNLTLRHLTKTYSPLLVTAWASFFATASMAFSLPNALIEIETSPWFAVLILIYLGAASNALSFLLWNSAIKLAVKTSSVTNWMFVTPISSASMALIMLGEKPDLATYCGGAVILLGLFLFQRFK